MPRFLQPPMALWTLRRIKLTFPLEYRLAMGAAYFVSCAELPVNPCADGLRGLKRGDLPQHLNSFEYILPAIAPFLIHPRESLHLAVEQVFRSSAKLPKLIRMRHPVGRTRQLMDNSRFTRLQH